MDITELNRLNMKAYNMAMDDMSKENEILKARIIELERQLLSAKNDARWYEQQYNMTLN